MPATSPPPSQSTVPEPAHWLPRYGSELFRYARRRVATTTAAEELVQETFVSALAALDSFRQQASERTWLFAILRHKLINYYHQQARSPLVPLPAANEADAYFETVERVRWRKSEEPREWSPADTQLEQQELAEQLQRCQEQLPPQQQAVFSLRFIDELSGEAICKELGISPSNYWVMVHRAKLQLRKCLEKHWFAGS